MSTVSEVLTEAARREPDLASYYEFHRTLFRILDQARAEISGALETKERSGFYCGDRDHITRAKIIVFARGEGGVKNAEETIYIKRHAEGHINDARRIARKEMVRKAYEWEVLFSDTCDDVFNSFKF